MLSVSPRTLVNGFVSGILRASQHEVVGPAYRACRGSFVVSRTRGVQPVSLEHRRSGGFRHAIIGGRHKCLRTGQRCTRRYDRQYHRYGFHCHGRRLTRAARRLPSLPAAGRIIARIPLPGDPQHLTFGADSLWVTMDERDTLLRVDASTNAVVARIPLVRQQVTAGRCGFGAGSVWVSNFDDNSVSRIDPATNTVVATIPVTLNPTGVAFGAGSVWVTNHRAGTISRIDPATNRVVAEIPVGPAEVGGPQVIAASAGAIWVTVPNARALVRIDPESNAVVARITDGPSCGSLKVSIQFGATRGARPIRSFVSTHARTP